MPIPNLYGCSSFFRIIIVPIFVVALALQATNLYGCSGFAIDPSITLLPMVLLLNVAIVTSISMKRWVSRNLQGEKRLFLPPGPKGWPLVGSIPEMVMRKGQTTPSRWILQLMKEMKTEIACIRLGSTYVIPVTSPELASQFLKKQDKIFSSRPVFTSLNITTNGFKTVFARPPDDEWMKMRRILASHILCPATHDWLQDKRMDEANHLVRFVYNRCKTSSGIVNVRAVARHYCGNVIRKLTLGKRFFGKGTEDEGPTPQEEEHVEAFFTLLSYTFAFGIADYMPCLSVFDIDGHARILKKAVASARKYIDPEIDERILMWKKGTKIVEEDMVDVLIMLKDVDGTPLLRHDEIKDLVFEMMIATMDNPSNAFEWALAEMVNQPKILEKATQELDSVVGRDRLVHESDLPRLNYVKACIREAFRLHPIAPFNVPHASTEDAVVGGYFIPKGSVILASRYGLGRNPRVWEEALKFKPERHLKVADDRGILEVVLTDSESKILSFSTGRRGCVGVRLGSVITTMLFARLLQGFTWTAPPDSPTIPLTESKHDFFLENPLLAVAKPRLPSHLYNF